MLSTKSYGNNSSSAAMRPKTAPLNLQPKVQIDKESTLLNERVWRDKVRLEKAQNDQAMVKSDVHIFVSKREDPLTNLREVLRDLSNAEAFKYMKQCRLMVARLKKCWFDTNEEIKSLTRTKEYLESSIEHIRKDLIINKAIVDLRTNRAQNEPNEDKVDDALEVEKQNLFYLKKSLEAILKPVQEQLYILDEVRERISKLEKERSVVTELICQCLTQSTRNFERAVSRQKAVAAPKLYRSKTTISSSLSSFAAAGNDVDPSSVNNIGPLSAFTAESVDILNESQAKIDLGRDLRIKSRLLIKECIDNAKNIGHIVNDSFVKKIEETLYLSKKLNLSSAENKLAQNRAIRWQDLNTVAMKYTLGPEKSTNLMISEQLDRPIIKTFQKHPGNQLPEAQEIIKGSEALEKSIIKSENHIKKLKIIGTKLDSSARDKELQHSIDSALLRRRREMADHRWVAEKYVK